MALKDAFTGISPKLLEEETNKGIVSFDKLVGSLSSAHDKKKELWKQIYNNAVTDRRNSYIMFTDLYTSVHGSDSNHAIHGAVLAKYMERLGKTTDQLIKLAEIIDDAISADEEDELSDPSDIYDGLEAGDHD